ncbi:MAG: hypothetical protein JOS17DRAFT_817557 [Linnemannia elongata]|nr:MAG: hypothetical protein JOS17DRAFT_817557 [Linnemannia elongata]
MNQNTNNQSQSSSAQRSSHMQQETKASAQKQQLQEQRSETPSHAGQSNIEAPMSGSKMCGHAFDCDCSTETAIHASEEHAPRTNLHHVQLGIDCQIEPFPLRPKSVALFPAIPFLTITGKKSLRLLVILTVCRQFWAFGSDTSIPLPWVTSDHDCTLWVGTVFLAKERQLRIQEWLTSRGPPSSLAWFTVGGGVVLTLTCLLGFHLNINQQVKPIVHRIQDITRRPLIYAVALSSPSTISILDLSP